VLYDLSRDQPLLLSTSIERCAIAASASSRLSYRWAALSALTPRLSELLPPASSPSSLPPQMYRAVVSESLQRSAALLSDSQTSPAISYGSNQLFVPSSRLGSASWYAFRVNVSLGSVWGDAEVLVRTASPLNLVARAAALSVTESRCSSCVVNVDARSFAAFPLLNNPTDAELVSRFDFNWNCVLPASGRPCWTAGELLAAVTAGASTRLPITESLVLSALQQSGVSAQDAASSFAPSLLMNVSVSISEKNIALPNNTMLVCIDL
jgi:hypothetical protein